MVDQLGLDHVSDLLVDFVLVSHVVLTVHERRQSRCRRGRRVCHGGLSLTWTQAGDSLPLEVAVEDQDGDDS